MSSLLSASSPPLSPITTSWFWVSWILLMGTCLLFLFSFPSLTSCCCFPTHSSLAVPSSLASSLIARTSWGLAMGNRSPSLGQGGHPSQWLPFLRKIYYPFIVSFAQNTFTLCSVPVNRYWGESEVLHPALGSLVKSRCSLTGCIKFMRMPLTLS